MKKVEMNPYTPIKGRISEILNLTPDMKLFKVKPDVAKDYLPGQFFMVSVWGAGEIPISVSSLPADVLEFCIKKVGRVSGEIHNLEVGQYIYLRGPYGNSFPTDIASNGILMIAGGIGILPLRPLIDWLIKYPKGGQIILFYGSKTPKEILFLDDIEKWRRNGIEVHLTVDMADERWGGSVGLVTELLKGAKLNFKDAISYICGPQVMIKATVKELLSFSMPEERIVTTLEAHMKCGIGKCGHCYGGSKYICIDGPIFTYKEILDYAISQ